MTGRAARGAAVVVAGLFAAAGVGTVPVVAVLVWVLLGVVAGTLIWVWTWLTDPAPGQAWDIAVRGGICVLMGGLALAGMTSVLGSATVAVIPIGYALAAVVIWRRSRRDSMGSEALHVATSGRKP